MNKSQVPLTLLIITLILMILTIATCIIFSKEILELSYSEQIAIAILLLEIFVLGIIVGVGIYYFILFEIKS